jgi:hypothetical protein
MRRLILASSLLMFSLGGALFAAPSTPGSAPQGEQRSDQIGAVELWYGVYEPGNVEIVEDKNNPGFKRQIQSGIKPPSTSSARVPLIAGTRFGIGYDLRGPRKGQVVALRHVRLLPAPGLRGPDGKIRTSLATDNNLAVGADGLFIGWTFGTGDPTGTWILQVFEGTRLLLERRFEVYRP